MNKERFSDKPTAEKAVIAGKYINAGGTAVGLVFGLYVFAAANMFSYFVSEKAEVSLKNRRLKKR